MSIKQATCSDGKGKIFYDPNIVGSPQEIADFSGIIVNHAGQVSHYVVPEHSKQARKFLELASLHPPSATHLQTTLEDGTICHIIPSKNNPPPSLCEFLAQWLNSTPPEPVELTDETIDELAADAVHDVMGRIKSIETETIRRVELGEIDPDNVAKEMGKAHLGMELDIVKEGLAACNSDLRADMFDKFPKGLRDVLIQYHKGLPSQNNSIAEKSDSTPLKSAKTVAQELAEHRYKLCSPDELVGFDQFMQEQKEILGPNKQVIDQGLMITPGRIDGLIGDVQLLAKTGKAIGPEDLQDHQNICAYLLFHARNERSRTADTDTEIKFMKQLGTKRSEQNIIESAQAEYKHWNAVCDGLELIETGLKAIEKSQNAAQQSGWAKNKED